MTCSCVTPELLGLQSHVALGAGANGWLGVSSD
jgi:hypothetical protein